MARCLFCDEWVGVNARWHESCLRDFEQNMKRRGLVQRLITSAMRTAVTAVAFLLGLFAAPSRPSSVPMVNAPTAPARRLPRRPEKDSERQPSWQQSDHSQ